MRALAHKTGVIALGCGMTAALSGCGGISSMSCEEIGARAMEISATQPIPVTEIGAAQETSRQENDVRCTAQARLSTGRTTTLYLRAYEENGDRKVAYQETPFR